MEARNDPGSLPEQVARIEPDYAGVPDEPIGSGWSLRSHFINMRLRLDRCARFVELNAPPVLVLNDVRLMRERLDALERAIRTTSQPGATGGQP